MATVYTRASKGSALTWAEGDANITNLNNDKIELTDISVTDSGGDGSLSYNNTTGVITYTGPSATDVRAHFSAGTGITITDGVVATTITQYTDSSARSALSAGTGIGYDSGTGVISSTITQYADSNARSAVSVTDAGGDGSLSYNNSTGVITYTGPSASEVRSHFSAGTAISITDGVVAFTGTQASGNELENVVEDTTPQLGGNLDLNSNNITGTGGISITGTVVAQSTLNAQTGTTYTTVLADASKLVTLSNASAITLTIPANSSVAYPVGTKIDFAQTGAGQVTVAGAGGVTVNATPTLKFRAQYSAASCIKTATDTWLLVGDLASE